MLLRKNNANLTMDIPDWFLKFELNDMLLKRIRYEIEHKHFKKAAAYIGTVLKESNYSSEVIKQIKYFLIDLKENEMKKLTQVLSIEVKKEKHASGEKSSYVTKKYSEFLNSLGLSCYSDRTKNVEIENERMTKEVVNKNFTYNKRGGIKELDFKKKHLPLQIEHKGNGLPIIDLPLIDISKTGIGICAFDDICKHVKICGLYIKSQDWIDVLSVKGVALNNRLYALADKYGIGIDEVIREFKEILKVLKII